MTIALKLLKGIPPTGVPAIEPPFTGGGTGASDPQHSVIDLLTGTLSLPLAGWMPAITPLKAGVWEDSATATGRRLLSQPNANVVENISLTAANRAAALGALADLLDFGRAAREYHEIGTYQPVQLLYTTAEGKENYALVYNIQAALVQFDPNKPTGESEGAEVQLTIEREPFWRPISFRWNPKAHTLNARGYTRVPSVYGAAGRPNGSNEWNTGNLTLRTSTTGYTSAVEATLAIGEEKNPTYPTASNFVDIPASAIKGDAPADIQFVLGDGIVNSRRILVAKTTLFNWSNQAYTTSNLYGLQHTYAAADAAVNPAGAPANITTTQPAAADGYLYQGSISAVDRRISQHVFGAGVAGSGPVLRWRLWQFNVKGRYALFLRHTCAANAADVQVYYTLADAGTIFYTSEPRRLDAAIAAFRAGSLYMGVLDLSRFNYPPVTAFNADGAQFSMVNDFQIQIHFIKTAATTPTVLLWDLTMLPLDEGVMELTPTQSTLFQSPMLYDNTSYLSSESATEQAALQSDDAPVAVFGSPIKLTPGIRNRLIFYLESGSGTFNPLPSYSLRLNILPRWSGLRGS